MFVITPGKSLKDLPQDKIMAKKADNTTFETTKELELVKVINIHRLGHRMYSILFPPAKFEEMFITK